MPSFLAACQSYYYHHLLHWLPKTKQNKIPIFGYVCSEPILFLTFSHASLLTSHTAAVLALALLFMIPAFLL